MARVIQGVLAATALLVAGACTPCEQRPGDVCLVVGTGELGFNRDGLAPEETDLFLVSAARRGPDDRLYIMDFNNQRLRRLADDGTVETVMGNGFHAIANADAPAVDSPLENPIDFDFFSDGRLVFVSYHDPRVMALDADGRLEVLAGADDGVVGVEAAYSGDGGPGQAAALQWPTALELGPAGALYIADTFNHVVRRLEPDGAITTVVGTGVVGAEGDGGPATGAQLNQPFGLALDDDGTLYIGDRGNFKIRRVDPGGTIETIAGVGVEGLEGDGGPALEASFGFVARVALDGDGLLVADQSNSTVRRITLR